MTSEGTTCAYGYPLEGDCGARACPVHGTASASPYGRRQGPRDARILYLPTFAEARAVRDAHPGSRVIEYLRGYAIQLRVSGPYVTREEN